jgi:hypothetical protein
MDKKTENTNGIGTKRLTTVEKTQHRKLKIEQHYSNKMFVKSGTPEGLAITAPHIASVVILLINIQGYLMKEGRRTGL